jgi:integrase
LNRRRQTILENFVPSFPVGGAGFLTARRERIPYANDDNLRLPELPAQRQEAAIGFNHGAEVSAHWRHQGRVMKEDERVHFGFHNFRHSLASSLVKLKCDPGQSFNRGIWTSFLTTGDWLDQGGAVWPQSEGIPAKNALRLVWSTHA